MASILHFDFFRLCENFIRASEPLPLPTYKTEPDSKSRTTIIYLSFAVQIQPQSNLKSG